MFEVEGEEEEEEEVLRHFHRGKTLAMAFDSHYKAEVAKSMMIR